MKNILYVLLLVSSYQLSAQEIIAKEEFYNINERNGKYFKDVNGVLDKFVGNWKYQDNPTNPSKILEVTFYKIENDETGGYFEDYLVAHYKYYENGIEIYNTENITNGWYHIYGGQFRDPQNTNKYHLLYDEPTEASKALRYNFNIEYLPNGGGTPQLQWDVEIVLEVAQGAQLPRIPQHIILTKQP